MPAVRPLRKIGLLLLGLVAVPLLLVAAAELAALGENERVLREVNDRYLDAVLTGVNQHIWAVTDAWAADLEDDLTDAADPGAALRAFLAAHPVLRAAFVADTGATAVTVASAAGAPPLAPADLGLEPGHVRRLLADRTAGYRRLIPVPVALAPLPDPALPPGTAGSTVALAYVTGAPPRVAGFTFDAGPFLDAEMAPRLREAAQEHFFVGVARGGEIVRFMTPVGFNPTAETVTKLGLKAPEDVKRLLEGPDVQERPLWVLEGHTLRIRPAGATIGEIVADRRRRSLLLLALLTVALAGGAALLFRAVRHQVELARAKAVFVQNVSHELRTPLALIRMYAETLEMGRVPETRRQEYVHTIAHEAGRLTRLVNNILNFSRIESGQKPITAAPFDLNALVEEALRLYRFHLDAEGFTLEVRPDPELPDAFADREAVSEALVNLLDNAVKYGGDARYLAVETGRDDGFVWVEVTDRGIGIAPREQARIFDEFYRVPTGAVHDVKGSGLGLALVKHLVEAQGGAVSVRSRPGAGSTFRFTLPAMPPPAPVRSDRPADLSTAPA